MNHPVRLLAVVLSALALSALPSRAETPEEFARRLMALPDTDEARIAKRKELTDDACRDLVPLLKSDGPDVPEGVARMLIWRQYSPAAEEVINYYAYRLPRTSGGLPADISKLGRSGAPALASLVLHHPSVEVQDAAAQALFAVYPGSLRRAMLDQQPLALDEFKPLIAVMLQAPLAKHRHWAIARALETLPEEVLDAVLKVLEKDPSPDVAKAAAHAVLVVASQRQAHPLVTPARTTPERVLAGVQSRSWFCRCQAADLADTAWSDEVRESLLGLLHDPDTRVREAAARSIFEAGPADKTIGPKLSDMLCSEDIEDQLAALLVLGQRRKSDSNKVMVETGSVWDMARRLAYSTEPRVRLAYVQAAIVAGRIHAEDLPQTLRTDTDRAVVQTIQAIFPPSR